MRSTSVSTFREVEKRLVRILEHAKPDFEQVRDAVWHLHGELGKEVYASLLFLLCHLQFSPSEAEEHWHRILEHHEELSSKLGHSCDFRVALLDYFIAVNQHFKNPKIIEIKIFQKTQNSAIRDELTGLYNSSYFRSELARELKRAERSGNPLSIAIFDIDYFKCYNDRNGHPEGDKVLRAVARAVKSCVRDGDLTARYGGEEFAVILPGATKALAFKVAERIRAKVEKLPLAHTREQPGGKLTLSGGVATCGIEASDVEGLIQAADQALYAAKSQGKNQITVPGGEFRTAPRYRVSIPGRLHRVSSDAESFLSDNLSTGGIRFRCRSFIEEGEIFRFNLAMRDVGREIEGLARAVKCAKGEDGYTVHAQFFQISSENARVLKQYLEIAAKATVAAVP